jgi:hypothetical protein
MAELADALDSGSSGVTLVGVQVPLFAPHEIVEESGEEPPPTIEASRGAGNKVGHNRGTRATLIQQLAAGVVAAVATGDLGAARVVHRAMGELLGPEAGELTTGIDLASERGKRGEQ